ncbi:methionyl-tRNA formyltransferase [Demequina sp. NBRC 110056]|uniref:methionyl-tRNA formyltransferase n=1 Tax=Demequina sp. NBRC 110056 TaxID=1570345 RepID=UPI000A049FA6|nr:methionyl-tRNA formyltransferase [Demequina sp. NBRC 110056]
MRLIFAGTPEIAIPSLEALAERHEIVAVVTQPDARGRRGKTLYPSPVKEHALEHGYPVHTPETAKDPEFIAAIADLDADAAAVVAYGQILGPQLLEATRHGWVNLHFSLLPAWRGAAPVQRSIMAGDEVTGASAFLLDAGMDTGPVIGTVTEAIRGSDTSGVLLERLATIGAPLLVQAIEALGAGAASPVAQPADGVSHAAKLSREDAYVRWDRPAHVVDRQIRGCTPAPGAWTTLPDGSPLKLGPVKVRADLPATVPGQLAQHGDAVTVGTGGHPVQLSWVQPAGKGQTAVDAWWRGARLGSDAILGEA